MEYKKRIFF